MHQPHVSEGTLLLGTLLGQDVTFEGVLTLDFSGTGQLKSLLGS